MRKNCVGKVGCGKSLVWEKSGVGKVGRGKSRVWEKSVWEKSRVGKVRCGKSPVWEKSVWEKSGVGKVGCGNGGVGIVRVGKVSVGRVHLPMIGMLCRRHIFDLRPRDREMSSHHCLMDLLGDSTSPGA